MQKVCVCIFECSVVSVLSALEVHERKTSVDGNCLGYLLGAKSFLFVTQRHCHQADMIRGCGEISSGRHVRSIDSESGTKTSLSGRTFP